MKPLLVLAGGFGTRLRSVVSDVPKPLAPVAGEPFLVHLVRHWVAQGVNDFVFLLHYEASKIELYISELKKDPKYRHVKFRSITEGIPLGTGGSILNAIRHLGLTSGFLVANADTWLGGGITEINVADAPTLVAVKVKNVERYGALELLGSKVAAFKEKDGLATGGYVNSGLYHLLPTVFENFEAGSFFSLETDVFTKLTDARQLDVVKLKIDFIDIGIPDDYARFLSWKRGEISL